MYERRQYGFPGEFPEVDYHQETEMEQRERLRKENPIYTRHTDTQIRAMLHSANPEWFDAALRREAEDRGMKSAPWAETKLADVLDFLRERAQNGDL